MDKQKRILADVLTFAVIALIAGLFGYSDAGGDVALIGRVVCYTSVVLAALSLVVKRPPTGTW